MKVILIFTSLLFFFACKPSVQVDGTSALDIIPEAPKSTSENEMKTLTEWDELKNWYTLTHFDGTAVEHRTATVERDHDYSFYNALTSQYVNTLVFPLYSAVYVGTDSAYTFGPMEHLGTSKITTLNGVKTYAYSYHGPIRASGRNVTLNLDLTVVQEGLKYSVSYTLEVPGIITKTWHQYVMTR
ncbi:MAG: hypothetical protein H7061_01890 [Bdellovibrionaceae bacterium]|nr:hypothetical protein [Bdellovibrio sp.]